MKAKCWPENGYPLRGRDRCVRSLCLVLGLAIWVGEAWGTKDEAIHYVDFDASGLHRQYTLSGNASRFHPQSGGNQLLIRASKNIPPPSGWQVVAGKGPSCRSRVDGGRTGVTAA